MNVKLEDVAREAGVSIATVSRVLNNHPVKESTKALVEETIARLDYRPNLTARGLINGKSQRIGVIVSNMENPYFSSIMNSMEQRMRESGYLCGFSSAPKRELQERDIIDQYLDSGVDGLILVDVMSRYENTGLYAELSARVPTVLINGNPDRRDVSQVLVDQEKGIELAAKHLAELGHVSFVFIRGPEGDATFDLKERLFLSVLEQAGIAGECVKVVYADDPDQYLVIEQTAERIIPFLSGENAPTAVFACNEIIGLGVMDAARKLGLSIPEDLSLLAFDNTYISKITSPRLTTVDLFPSRLGLEAAEMMLQLLRTEAPYPKRVVLEPELVVRESCRKV